VVSSCPEISGAPSTQSIRQFDYRDPAGSAGVIVLRPGPTHSRAAILAVLERFVAQLATSDLSGRLWIVEPERVRQYQPEGD
jgi:hypothetical protein